MRARLTDVLKGWGRIDEAMIAKAVALHRRWGKRIGEALVELGFVHRNDVVNALAFQAGLKAVDLGRVTAERAAVALVPQRIAERFRVVPLRLGGQHDIAVAIAAPVSLDALDAVRAVTRRRVVPFIADEALIAAALESAYGGPHGALEIELDDAEADEAPPLVTVPLASCVGGI